VGVADEIAGAVRTRVAVRGQRPRVRVLVGLEVWRVLRSEVGGDAVLAGASHGGLLVG
jgi:hypothetical protein